MQMARDAIAEKLLREIRLMRELADELLDGYHSNMCDHGVEIVASIDPEVGVETLRAVIRITPRQPVTCDQVRDAQRAIARVADYVTGVEFLIPSDCYQDTAGADTTPA